MVIKKYKYLPKYRDAEQEIIIYEGLKLSDIYKLNNRVVDILRFCMTDSGTLLFGDAFDVLHQDICLSFEQRGEYNALFVGAAIKEKNIWLIRFQGLASRSPKALAQKLSTWNEFIEEANIQYIDGWVNL